MIKACIIGISGFGRVHYQDLIRETASGRMQALGATVINQDEEKEKCEQLRELGCTLFTDYREMLSSFKGDIDICFIPTGIHLHAPMSIDALHAGANVFVEKPLAATVQEVAAMKAAEESTGKFVAVGYQSMYASETLEMKRHLLDKRLGTVRSIKYWGLWPRMDGYYSRNAWAGSIKVGDSWVLDSPFNNALAHQLNMICFLAGASLHAPARLTTVQAELYRAHEIENADTACMRICTAEGPALYCFVTHCSESQSGPIIEALCDNGTLCWKHGSASLTFKSGETQTIECDDDARMRSRLTERLCDRIRNPDVFVCDLDIAGTQTLATNAAHESSAVNPVPAALIERRPEKQSTKTIIKGIDDAILQAFEEEKLFSEMGIEWAVPGSVFRCSDYNEFTGGRTGIS